MLNAILVNIDCLVLTVIGYFTLKKKKDIIHPYPKKKKDIIHDINSYNKIMYNLFFFIYPKQNIILLSKYRENKFFGL